MKNKILLATLIALAFSGTALAEPEFRISGFGTVSAVHSNNSDGDYLIGFRNTGPGQTHATDFGADTMAAVQLSGKFDSKWSGIVQVTTQRNADSNFAPQVEWANIKYAVTPDLSLRVGRIGLPVFMVSDYRLVGYANTWVRSPVEVYNLVPISNADGIDFTYRLPVGEALLNLQGAYTKTSVKLHAPGTPNSETVNVRNQHTASATLEAGKFTFRLGYSDGDVEYQPAMLSPLVAGLQMLAAVGAPGAGNLLADRFSTFGKVTFTGIGASYDDGKFLVQSEYVQRRADKGLIPAKDAGYILGGVRVDKVTPYVIYSRDKAKGPFTSTDANQLAAFGNLVGGSNGALIGMLASGVQTFYLTDSIAQSTVSLGARYDVMKNVALKAQFDHIRPDSGEQTGSYPQSKKNTNLVTLSVDFLF